MPARGGRSFRGGDVPNAVDIAEQRYGRLVARRRIGTDGNGQAVWACDCDCGTRDYPVTVALLRRKTRPARSCGCLADEARSQLGRTVGAANLRAAAAAGTNCPPEVRRANGLGAGAANLADHKVAVTGREVCPACREEFDRRGRQVYCSEDCRLRGVDAAAGPDRCAHCDGTMDRRGYARRYCSNRCKRLAARAAAKARLAEARRVAAAERD